MNHNMYITGISWITADGNGTGSNNDPFEYNEGILKDISGKDFPPNPVFRKGRLDRFSLLGLQTITNALYDAYLYECDEKREIGIVASTVYGCLKTDLDYHDTVVAEDGSLPEPNLFTHTLSNVFLGYAAILFGLTGPNYIYYEKTNKGTAALVSAMECINLGECNIMLAGICDVEPPSNFPVNDTVKPGSIFIVIEKSINDERRHFGMLSMDRAGNVLLDKSVINDIAECVKECLKNKLDA
ncbi:beta-ketoacyl synthase N-terminal-like domain-containing protein [Thermodesulfobacteriota bacterium]